ncbi:MAG: ABC transporter permease [Saprospiraceae bacterium]
MIDYDKWQEIFTSLQQHKLRTFLTAFSVWWGIFMLVILLGAGTGLENSITHNFRDDAINSIWVFPGETSKPYKGLPVGRRISIDNDDFDKTSKIDGVRLTTGRYYLNGTFFISKGDKSFSYDVRSVHPAHQVVENTMVTEGRYINDLDIQKTRKVCVIGRTVKESFFEEEESVLGEYLQVKGIEYKIVGVFTDSGSPREMEKIYLPISTSQKVDGTDRLNMLIYEIGDASLEESLVIEEKIKNQFALKHKFSNSDERAVYVRNGIESYEEFQTVFTFIRGFIWFVGIGSIIAGVIGVSNIMLIIVKDRTKEIGVRKALGATPWSIITMIVQEAIFLTGIAGYVGLASGLGIIYGLQQIMVQNDIEIEYFRNPEVNTSVVVAALFILILSGAVAGLIPALQAVRVNPVTAMKS